MPIYHTLGKIPRKRHIAFKKPGGGIYAEELVGHEGFTGTSALMYHIHPPTQVYGWKPEYSTKVEYVDRDFMRMMIPHHQGATDMALLQLKYGHDEKLRRLAQSIIVEQGQEIAYMRMLLDPPHAETIGASRADH